MKTRYRDLAICFLALLLASPAAADKYKANNSIPLNQAASWTNNAVPTSVEFGVWSAIVAPPNTTSSLGANLTWGGIKILNPGGPVTLASGNTLTLMGVSGTGIDLGSASQNLTINCSLVLPTSASWSVGSSRTLTVNSAVGGSGSLNKIGAGVLVLGGACAYGGGTTIVEGTCLVSGSLPPSSALTVLPGATIGGTGIIGGPVMVQANGNLSPGIGGIGTLNINNTVTLLGTTTMELNKTAGTNDQVRGVTTLAYGGTLVVNNLAGTLAVGDSFKLFGANSYTGSFAAISPPTPGVGIEWDMSRLAIDGTLRVSLPMGYYNLTVLPGFNYIANQLNRDANRLGQILPSVPDGSMLQKWNKATQTWLPPDTFDIGFGGWVDSSMNPSTTTLNPGEGAAFFNPSPAPLLLAFAGYVPTPVLPVPLDSSSLSLLSAQIPTVASFFDVVGQDPTAGAQVIKWDAVAQNYRVHTYDGTSGVWVPATPTLALGESAFFRGGTTNPPVTSVMYAGSVHTSMGSATLNLTGDQLLVANLGSSGQDGVAISLVDKQGLNLHWNAVGSAPDGASLSVTAQGLLNGTERVLAESTATRAGANVELKASFPMATNALVNVELYLSNNLVATYPNLSGPAVATALSPTWWWPWDWHIHWVWRHIHGTPLVVLVPVVHWTYWPFPVWLQVAGQPAVLADEIRLQPTYGLAGDFTSLTTVKLTGSGIGSVTFDSEAPTVLYAGSEHTPMGDARLAVQGGVLAVTNLGTNGLDGVAVSLAGSEGVNLHWNAVGNVPLPEGGKLQMDAHGMVSGTERLIASAQALQVGTNLEISATFPLATNAMRTVELYLSNTLVTTFTTDVTMVARTYGMINDLHLHWIWKPVWIWPGYVIYVRVPVVYVTWCHWPVWPVYLDVPGQGLFMADEMRISPVHGMVGEFTSLTKVNLTGKQAGSLMLDAESEAVDFAAIRHESLGNAQLMVSSNTLTVAGIGTNGQDGVTLNLQGRDGLDLQWNSIGAQPPGAALSVAARAMIGGSEQVAATATASRAGSDVNLTVGFPLATNTQKTVELYSGGALVATYTNLTSSLVGYYPGYIPWDWHVYWVWKPIWFYGHVYWIRVPVVYWSWWLGPIWLTVPGQPAYLVDEIRVSPNYGLSGDYSGMTAVTLTGSQINSVVLSHESTPVMYAGRRHVPSGAATLTVSSNCLVVANLGASGQDGAMIDLKGSEGVDLHWSSANGFPDGATLASEARAMMSGVEQVVATSVAKRAGSDINISVAFPLATNTVKTVALYSNSVMVATFTNVTGSLVAITPYWPHPWDHHVHWIWKKIVIFGRVIWIRQPVVYWTWWPWPIWVTVPGQTTPLQVDEIRVSPTSAIPGTFEGMTTLKLTGTQLGSLVLDQETASVTYAGSDHLALGAAQVSMQSNRLMVANLGSSGQDGVSIALPGKDGMDLHWESIGAAPEGASLAVAARGMMSGTEQLVAQTAATVAGSNVNLTVAFPIASNALNTVELYSSNKLVASFTGVSSGLVAIAPYWPWPWPWDSHIHWVWVPIPGTSLMVHVPRIHWTWWPWWHGPILLQVPGYGSYPVDEIRVWPTYGVRGEYGGLTAVDIRGTRVGSVVLDGQTSSVSYSGLDDQSLGNAQLTVQSNQLVVANLGSSGQDGVSVNLAGKEGLDLHWDTVGSFPNGAMLTVDARAMISGQEQLAAHAEARQVGTNLQVTASFPLANNDLRTVELYLDNALVTSFTASGTVVAYSWSVVNDLHIHWTHRHIGLIVIHIPVFHWTWCHWPIWPVYLTVPGRGQFMADEIRISPTDGIVGEFTSMTAVDVRGMGVTSMVIDQQSAAPVPGPTLSVALETGGIAVAWSTNYPGYQLVGTATLTTPQWQPVTVPPLVEGGRYVVHLPAPAASQFYRLMSTSTP